MASSTSPRRCSSASLNHESKGIRARARVSSISRIARARPQRSTAASLSFAGSACSEAPASAASSPPQASR